MTLFSFFAPFFFLPICKVLLCFFTKKLSGIATIYLLDFLGLTSAASSIFLFEVSPSFLHAFLLTSTLLALSLLPYLLCLALTRSVLWLSFLPLFHFHSNIQFGILNVNTTLFHFVLLWTFPKLFQNFSKRRLKCSLVERFVTRKWMSLFSFSLFSISCHTFLRFTVLGLKCPQTDLPQGRLLPNPLAPDHCLDWEVGRCLCNNTLACLPW